MGELVVHWFENLGSQKQGGRIVPEGRDLNCWRESWWGFQRKQGRNQFIIGSVAQLCPTLCDPVDYSTPGFPVHHQLPELAQTHGYPVSDAIQPSHPLSCPSLSTFNLFQHQGLFQWVSSLHQVAKVLEFQLQHQSFQWMFRTDFL